MCEEEENSTQKKKTEEEEAIIDLSAEAQTCGRLVSEFITITFLC